MEHQARPAATGARATIVSVPHEPEPEPVLRAAVLSFSILLQHIAREPHWTGRFLLRR